MISFKNYHNISEGLGSFSYKVPKNKEQLLYDFYVMVGVPIWVLNKKSYKVRNYEEIVSAHDDVKDKLLTYLKKHLLEQVLLSVSAEFHHVFDENFLFDIKNKLKNDSFFNKYSDTFTKLGGSLTLHNDLDAVLPFKAYKSTKIAPNKFIELAKQAFLKLKWYQDFGGKSWADICSAWQRLYGADSDGDLIMAIDHIYDIQHNTDTVFNKLDAYLGKDGTYKWIIKALDHKAKAETVMDFYKLCSPSLKSLIAMVIKEAYDMTVDKYLKGLTIQKAMGLQK